MDLFVRFLTNVTTSAFKTILCTIIGLLLRHTTNSNNEICNLGIADLLANLTKDADAEVRRRATAALGEYLFYGATQLDGSEENSTWEIKDVHV
jgi:serine/threonine-protein kinase ULK4